MKERKRFAVVAWHVIGQEKAGESDRERQKESEKRDRERKRKRRYGVNSASFDWPLGAERLIFLVKTKILFWKLFFLEKIRLCDN